MKFMIIGDVHLADRPPSSRKDTYREDILDKLEWVVDRANDEGVDAILQLGDMFHIKAQNKNSHYLVQKAARILGQSKSPVRIVGGNHDVEYDRIEDLNRQPLGTLALHPNISLTEGLDPDFPIYGIPYFDLTPENLDRWATRYHDEAGPEEAPFIITHSSLFPEAQAPIYEYVSYESWAAAFQNKYTLYGHIHTQVKGGPHYKMGEQWFINEGSLSRGSLHESSLNRKPSVALYDDSDPKNPFSSIYVPFKPAEEVFKLDVVEVLKAREDTVAQFLETLNSSELDVLTVEGILASARTRKELPKQALRELEEIVEGVVTE